MKSLTEYLNEAKEPITDIKALKPSVTIGNEVTKADINKVVSDMKKQLKNFVIYDTANGEGTTKEGIVALAKVVKLWGFKKIDKSYGIHNGDVSVHASVKTDNGWLGVYVFTDEEKYGPIYKPEIKYMLKKITVSKE